MLPEGCRDPSVGCSVGRKSFLDALGVGIVGYRIGLVLDDFPLYADELSGLERRMPNRSSRL